MSFPFQFLQSINCYPPCHVPTYDVKVMPTISGNRSPDGNPWVQLTLVAPRPAMTHREEFLVYDSGSMAGDVGGLLGILTGASILAMYDYLVLLASGFKKYVLHI